MSPSIHILSYLNLTEPPMEPTYRRPIDWQHLTAPFPPRDIEWKPGAVTRDRKKGLAMPYITARAVQERLDDVFGPGNWKNEFRAGPEGGVICRIYFKNDDGEWVWREDGADNTEVEAIKGGLSNAMKRAGAALGIGRYLYDMPQQWVPLNEKGRFAEVPRIPAQFIPGPDRTRSDATSHRPPTNRHGNGQPVSNGANRNGDRVPPSHRTDGARR